MEADNVNQSQEVPGTAPSRVARPSELAAGLDSLRRRRGLSYEAMEAEAAKLPAPKFERIGKSTVGEIVTGKRMPTKAKLLTFLAVCRVGQADLPQWIAAWERAATADLDKPMGAIRVRDCEARTLGVHAAIQVDGAAADMPQYVARHLDGTLRSVLESRAHRGCFLLLVGGSSVGKTRTLFEAVLATLPDWWLVHPASAAEIRTLAAAPTPRTVVWLDELQRYLEGDEGLDVGTVRSLTAAGSVLVGTLWPEEYSVRITARQAAGSERYRRDAEVLGAGYVLDLADTLTDAEIERARELAAADERLRIALADQGVGLTQILAAGPELVRRWTQAPTPSIRALLTAAIDARRLGVLTPLTRAQLGAAVPGYLTPAQRAAATTTWLTDAISYATALVHGAAAALTPVGVAMGRASGYVVADYLLHHVMRERVATYPPPTFWRAMIEHRRTPADLHRLADAARRRGRLRRAVLLYTHALVAGDHRSGYYLGELYRKFGELDTAAKYFEQAGEAGVHDGFIALARLRWEEGDQDGAEELCRRAADEGYPFALHELASMYRNAGDELRHRVLLKEAGDRGHSGSLSRLADLYRNDGDLNNAEKFYRLAWEAGDVNGLRLLAWMFQEIGRTEDAKELYLTVARAGLPSALRDLALMFEELGDRDAAERTAAEALSAGHPSALRELANHRLDAGDSVGAERILNIAIASGDKHALLDLAEMRDQAGDKLGADALINKAIAADVLIAVEHLARRRENEGDVVEAVRLYQQAADSGVAEAWRHVVRLDPAINQDLSNLGLTKDDEFSSRFQI